MEVISLKVEDFLMLPTTFYDESTLKEKWTKTLPWMRINTLKQHSPTYDFSPIPSFLAEEIRFYLELEKPEWLFPSNVLRGQHVNVAIVTDRFRFYCKKTGLETVYGYAEDANNLKKRKDGLSRRLVIEKSYGFGRHTY